MKPLKLHIDVRPEEQEESTYPFGKNGIQYDLAGSSFNEPGFRKLSNITVPYVVNGVIETDKYPIVFSTDNTSSAIGLFNTDTETYEPVVDDATWTLVDAQGNRARLGFKTANYITGQSQRNYKGELTVAFTDKSTWPKFLNIDNPALSSIDDMRLFPYFTPPSIKGEQITGGSVAGGAYYAALAYEKTDGTSTAYSTLSQVIIIQPGATGNADKAITFTITGADTNYNYIRIAIISKVNGVTSAIELNDTYPITGGVIKVTYTGVNIGTTIDPSTILTPPALYNRVGTIGQLNDYLYIGDLDTEPDLNDMQPYALAVQLEWISSIQTPTAPTAGMLSGAIKGFMHQEVYAIYIRYKKVRGGFTKWFITAGNTPKPADLADSSEATAGGATTSVPKFKCEDTIPYFDNGSNTGGTGIWKNDTEVYPDTPDFDASAIGGRNLRGQPVLHHRMPSLAWCKENLYPALNEYGKTKLDLLGIRAINVRIPDKYIGIIDGYEIGYAIRTVDNMTVYGQSLLLHGVTDRNNMALPDGTAPIWTSGGNWTTSVVDRGHDDNLELKQIRTGTFRFHSFDLLFNKPAITPTFVSAQLSLYRGNLDTEGYLEDASIGGGAGSGPVVHLIDYTQGDTPGIIGTGHKLRFIKSSTYLDVTVNADNFINVRHENCYAGYMAGNSWPMTGGESGFRNQRWSYTETTLGSPKYEKSYLINLIAVKADIYTGYQSQPLSSAGLARPITDNTPFFGGDSYVSDYTFHTYGRHSSEDFNGSGTDTGIGGIKAIRRFVCESVSNIALRYEVPGNIYSQWYPHNPTVAQNPDACYITRFQRSQDPNQFGYTRDFNALNNLIDSTIYSPFQEYLTTFPYRIHRGGKAIRTGKPRAWRTFLPLDYYEMQKNMGRMVHLEGMDDRLIIHMENAMFLTQDKARLEGGLLSVTLGTGDIFQFEPQEGQSAKLGYAGTRHELACVRTPAGYMFVDAQLGEIFLFKGKLMNLNEGVNTFLRDYLRIKDSNVFTGNGITIGYDQRYKRLLITVKNVQAPPGTVPKQFQDTNDFWDNLQVDDVVLYNGRLIQYKGVNDTEFDCPPDPVVHTYTWIPQDPYCLVDGDSNNTGMKGYNTRARKTDGVLDGHTEPNSPTTGTGPYFPPVLDLAACPPPAPVVSWQKSEPVCEHEYTQPATVTDTGQTLAASQNIVYTQYKTRIYKPGIYTETEIGNITPGSWAETELTTAHLWINTDGTTSDGPANRHGVFITGGVGAGVKVTIPFAYNNTGLSRTVYVGIFGDNEFEFKFNGTTIAITDGTSNDRNFKIFHLFPCVLRTGTNYFNVVGTGSGGPSDSVGMLVLDNTVAEISAAATEGDLTILFKSDTLIGETINVASCPDGWVLDNTGGSYVCRKTGISTPPGTGITDEGNTGTVIWDKRCRLSNGVPDGYCEDNTSGGPNPYFPPEENEALCPKPTENLGILCGTTITNNYNGTDFHAYDKVLINNSGTVPVTMTLNWNSYDRPNRFSILEDGSTIITTGWKGIAGYTGPWGTSLSTTENGTITWTTVVGSKYEILVETGPASTDNPQSDSYEFTLNC